MLRGGAPSFALIALLGILAANGCGSSGSDQNLTACGNSHVDAEEGCDDGNLDDHDACTSACQTAVCGDGVAHAGVEDCDGRDLNGGSCSAVGLTGEPACDGGCQYDYSACGPPPTPTAPPTATFTPAPPTATPTSTPASSCGDGLLSLDEDCTSCPDDCEAQPCPLGPSTVTATVSLMIPATAQVSQVRVQLAYRTNILSLPDTGLLGRFEPAPSQPGLRVRPTDLDYAVDVQVARTGLVSGPIFTVSFDLCTDAAAPGGSDLACLVTNCGTLSGCTCTADVP